VKKLLPAKRKGATSILSNPHKDTARGGEDNPKKRGTRSPYPEGHFPGKRVKGKGREGTSKRFCTAVRGRKKKKESHGQFARVK